ncbi:hypothetical protein EW026_g6892 [Hermanssonia centrifuga]|uniref:Uncharacterized protein n=1 Tax=Hermanssonia centrifuga TaxID=98765 RepID=A0A4S4KAJ8_9APHY|nr:hypothetical protein EW026_g6892 [Hermanssonia centrifuga]
MPVLASDNGQMSSGVSSRPDNQAVPSLWRRLYPASTRTSPETEGDHNPFEDDEAVRRRIEAVKKVLNAISRPFKSVRTSVSTWMVEHGPDEIEEDEIVRESSSDLDVLAAVDAIQSDDELLATVVREAVWQIQPEPYADTTINFILEIIGHRLQRNGQVIHLLLPLDLSVFLTERAWHAVTEMAAELLKREVRRQLTQGNNGDYARLSWKPWMSTALLLLMSKSKNCVSEDGGKIIQHCIQYRFDDVHLALTSRLDPERAESALRDPDMKFDDEEGAFLFDEFSVRKVEGILASIHTHDVLQYHSPLEAFNRLNAIIVGWYYPRPHETASVIKLLKLSGKMKAMSMQSVRSLANIVVRILERELGFSSTMPASETSLIVTRSTQAQTSLCPWMAEALQIILMATATIVYQEKKDPNAAVTHQPKRLLGSNVYVREEITAHDTVQTICRLISGPFRLTVPALEFFLEQSVYPDYTPDKRMTNLISAISVSLHPAGAHLYLLYNGNSTPTSH